MKINDNTELFDYEPACYYINCLNLGCNQSEQGWVELTNMGSLLSALRAHGEDLWQSKIVAILKHEKRDVILC